MAGFGGVPATVSTTECRVSPRAISAPHVEVKSLPKLRTNRVLPPPGSPNQDQRTELNVTPANEISEANR